MWNVPSGTSRCWRLAAFHNWKSKLKGKRGDIWQGSNNTALVSVLSFSGDEFIGASISLGQTHQTRPRTPLGKTEMIWREWRNRIQRQRTGLKVLSIGTLVRQGTSPEASPGWAELPLVEHHPCSCTPNPLQAGPWSLRAQHKLLQTALWLSRRYLVIKQDLCNRWEQAVSTGRKMTVFPQGFWISRWHCNIIPRNRRFSTIANMVTAEPVCLLCIITHPIETRICWLPMLKLHFHVNLNLRYETSCILYADQLDKNSPLCPNIQI